MTNAEQVAETKAPSLEAARATVAKLRKESRARVDSKIDKAIGGITNTAGKAIEWSRKLVKTGVDKSLDFVADLTAGEDMKAAKEVLKESIKVRKAEVAAMRKRLQNEKNQETILELTQGIGSLKDSVADMWSQFLDAVESDFEKAKGRNGELGRQLRDGWNTTRLNHADKLEKDARERADRIRRKMSLLGTVES